MSKWNAFQSAHAGQGLSSSQMSAMYHASNSSSSSGGGGGGGGSSSYSSGGGGSSNSSGGGYYSSPASARPASASSSATSRSSSSSNAWNAYQRAHAGEGLSRAEMSAGYQASRSSSASSASHANISNSYSSSSSRQPASRPASAASSTSRSSSSSTPNAWNEYQRAHAGEGLSRAAMAAGYRAAQSPPETSSKPSAKPAAKAKATTASSSKPSVSKTSASVASAASSNDWNEFQRRNAGRGLSTRQMSMLYKNQHQSAASASQSKPSASGRSKQIPATPTSPARRPNAFNEFQKQFKADHPHEKLNGVKAAELYRAKQREEQERQSLEPKASALPLRERLLREAQRIQEVQLGVAMQQQEPEISWEEREEWTRAARHLEWEEANYLRQLYVQTLGSTVAWGDLDRSLFGDCEVIDAGRLDLAMDDDKRIGSGGSGSVYAAVVDGDIPVAVKVIDGVGKRSKKLFEQEMLALVCASEHQNVLQVLGYSVLSNESGRESYGIIMELMAGGDLAFALHCDDNVSLSEDSRLQILLQVIKAIEFLHKQGITHRDIKPHNILLSANRKVAKLADFGLAGFKNTTLTSRQSRSSTTTSSETVMALGLTPSYAAPEVFEGKLSFKDHGWKKSDVFSFTILLAEVIMEAQPWEFETAQYVKRAVCKNEQRPFEIDELVVFGKAGNSKLQSLVQDGWSQDPRVRPSASEVRQRLEKIIDEGKASRRPGATSDSKYRGYSRVSSPRGVDGM